MKEKKIFIRVPTPKIRKTPIKPGAPIIPKKGGKYKRDKKVNENE